MAKQATIYRTDNANRYFKEIGNKRYAPIEDSIIRKMFREDRNKYKENIINANIRLVATIAKEFDRQEKFLDYNQEGIEGLMEAFDKYNPEQPAKFSTYAGFWIRAKMSLLCTELNIVQRSNQRKIGSKVKKFQEKFLLENMREASQAEIVEHLSENCGIDIHYGNEVYDIKVSSINAELSDDGDGFTQESNGEFAIRTASENDYNKEIEREDMAMAIKKMMRSLNEKERTYITRHIYNDETYESISDSIGCSVERVRQIVVGGLAKMKKSEYAKTHYTYFL